MILTCWGEKDGWCGKRHFVEEKALACAASPIGASLRKKGRPPKNEPPNGRPSDRSVYYGSYAYETIRDTGAPPSPSD